MNKRKKMKHTMPKEKKRNYAYGNALAKAYGIPRELVLSVQSHILSILAGPNPKFRVFDSPLPFRAGGMVIAGAQARIGSLVDQLLAPIHELQGIGFHARQSLDELCDSTVIAEGTSDNHGGPLGLDEHLAYSDTRRDLIHNLGTLNRKRYAATRPLLLLEGAETSTILSHAAESKDASPLWFDRGCRLGQAGKKTVSVLLPWLQGQHAKPAKDAQLRFSRIGYLATLEIDALSNLTNDNLDCLRAIQANSNIILMPERTPGEEANLSFTSKELKDELLTWERAIKQVVIFRDEEAILSATGIRTKEEDLRRYQLKSIRESGKSSSILDSQILNDLMPKFLFGVTILSLLGARFGTCPLHLACKLQQFLFHEQVSAENWIEDQANRSALDRDKAAFIRALERRGPCSWPQLRRSLNKQGREDNEATINALIAEGRLSLDDCGVFQLKEKKEAA